MIQAHTIQVNLKPEIIAQIDLRKHQYPKEVDALRKRKANPLFIPNSPIRSI